MLQASADDLVQMDCLLFTEGLATEPAYFEALTERFAIPDCRVISGKGPAPLSLLSAAIAAKIESPTKTCWLVLDAEAGTDHPRQRQLRKALGEAQSRGIGVALSNPSFEFWLLLHERELGDKQAPTTPLALARRLGKAWGGFAKAELPMERLLQVEALDRALRQSATLSLTEVLRKNPSTNVGVLVASLLARSPGHFS